jgi:hypothetical protein
VTGKLGHIKDESIQNFAMNSALKHIEEHMHKTIVDGKVDLIKAIELFDEAKKTPSGLLHAAGDIGSRIHDRREEYFQAWIDTYMAHKPKKWASLRAIEGDVCLENCVKRVLIACSWEEAEALRRMELALKYLKKHERPFWSEERHSFATMLRKETMHMMAWYESALDLNLGTDAEPSVPTAKRYEVADMPNPATYRQELAARINQAHARRA